MKVYRAVKIAHESGGSIEFSLPENGLLVVTVEDLKKELGDFIAANQQEDQADLYNAGINECLLRLFVKFKPILEGELK